MAGKTDTGLRWCLSETPNPSEVTLVTFVERSNVYPRDIPTVGSQFKDWTRASGFTELVPAHGTWVFTQMKTQDAPGAVNAFYWAKTRTDAARNTPFRVTSKYGNHRWPPILKSLRFILARDFPIAAKKTKRGGSPSDPTETVFANRYLTREVYIPAVDEGSRFVIEEFVSETPFTIPQYPVPTTTSISYHYLNLKGGFPECLHKTIRLSNLVTTTSVNNGTLTSSNYNQLEGQVFPATNFTEWAPYVVSDDQDQVNGIWYRKRVRVYPPPEPNTITNVS